MLERRQYGGSPARSGYHLTAAGRDLLPALQALMQWGNTWLAEEPPVVLHHHDHRVDGEWVCRTCGEPVAASRVERVITPTGRRLTDGPGSSPDGDGAAAG